MFACCVVVIHLLCCCKWCRLIIVPSFGGSPATSKPSFGQVVSCYCGLLLKRASVDFGPAALLWICWPSEVLLWPVQQAMCGHQDTLTYGVSPPLVVASLELL
ncbi:hypothetical protein U1Q18_029194 [Sarracenia purpurea var. burkii]